MLQRERDFARASTRTPPDEHFEELAGPEEKGARYMSAEEFFDGLEGSEDAEGE